MLFKPQSPAATLGRNESQPRPASQIDRHPAAAPGPVLRPPAAELLRVEELAKSYRRPCSSKRNCVFSGVNLQLKQDEICALIGESGSGKTTLARAILQLSPADRGRISLNGSKIFDANKGGLQVSARNWRQLRRSVQPIFQHAEAALNPLATARQAVAEVLFYLRLCRHRQQAAIQAQQLLLECGLALKFHDHYPHQLSDGQRQRAAIARALALRPQLLVADEPLASLDAVVRSQLVRLFLQLRQKYQLSFLWITHNLPLVSHLSDTVAVLGEGRILEYGPTMDVFSQPKHPYTRNLLAPLQNS